MDGQRTRMNISLTAKGQAQWEVTAEYAEPGETAAKLKEAIAGVRAEIKAAGLVECGATA